jgi:hypothetical protein
MENKTDMHALQTAMLKELKALAKKYGYGCVLELKLLRGSTVTTIKR